MVIDYDIINKNSIHLSIDEDGGESFLNDLSKLESTSTLKVIFEDGRNYRGKKLKCLAFSVASEGEYVSFQNGFLIFEIELEMVREFILFIKHAIIDGGFRTPEIMSFSPKTHKDVEVTIYGFLLDTIDD